MPGCRLTAASCDGARSRISSASGRLCSVSPDGCEGSSPDCTQRNARLAHNQVLSRAGVAPDGADAVWTAQPTAISLMTLSSRHPEPPEQTNTHRTPACTCGSSGILGSRLPSVRWTHLGQFTLVHQRCGLALTSCLTVLDSRLVKLGRVTDTKLGLHITRAAHVTSASVLRMQHKTQVRA